MSEVSNTLLSLLLRSSLNWHSKRFSEDVAKSTMRLYEKVKEKNGERVKSNVHKEFVENTTDAIREIEKLFRSTI